ncbi:hypothetical protein K439DRAFT_1612741 [Ramaria rubella]|nr:hypothetical protein K439DRAFT_1612741 [Ramaria rubella]
MSRPAPPPRSLSLARSNRGGVVSRRPPPPPPRPASAALSPNALGATSVSPKSDPSFLHDIPITPNVQRSHFSPTTPSAEKGFVRNGSLKRLALAVTPSKGPPAPVRNVEHGSKRSPRDWVRVVALALLTLFLVINVIVLNIALVNLSARVGSLPFAVPRPNADDVGAASALVSPNAATAAPQPSPTVARSTVLPSPEALSCLSQFYPNVSQPTNQSSYCAQCVAPLRTVDAGWIISQAYGTTNETDNVMAIAAAADFCDNLPASTRRRGLLWSDRISLYQTNR